MYKVNKHNNTIVPIKQISFTEAGFKERQHLQEWIAKNPLSLGEELLIIQKEFSGFDDTRERLDLLALDRNGNLVIVENKLDDTGKDVVWQALKYVSYCSSLTSQDIENIYTSYLSDNGLSGTARENLTTFFNDEEYEESLNIGTSQRVILVAGSYRKEVTSTVMWLLSNGIDIKCFKAVPYRLNEDVILDINQIIPVKEAQDYMIRIAEKQKEENIHQKIRGARHDVRKNFWKKYLESPQTTNELLNNLSPTTESWIGIGMGMSGVTLELIIGRKYTRTKININRGSQDLNKKTFDELLTHKESIEAELDHRLLWNRKDDGVTSSIDWQIDTLNVFNEEDHEDIINFFNTTIPKMYPAFKKHVDNLER